MGEESTEPDARPQLKCDWCGSPFRAPKATGRMPRYCRRSCRQRAYEARQTRAEVEAAVLLHTKGGGRVEQPQADQAAGPEGVESPTLW